MPPTPRARGVGVVGQSICSSCWAEDVVRVLGLLLRFFVETGLATGHVCLLLFDKLVDVAQVFVNPPLLSFLGVPPLLALALALAPSAVLLDRKSNV